jgi:hypothetical protein
MPEAVYVSAALLSAACAVLLFRGYTRTGVRLLFWSALCFVALALNNTLLFLDLAVVGPTLDLVILAPSATAASKRALTRYTRGSGDSVTLASISSGIVWGIDSSGICPENGLAFISRRVGLAGHSPGRQRAAGAGPGRYSSRPWAAHERLLESGGTIQPCSTHSSPEASSCWDGSLALRADLLPLPARRPRHSSAQRR